MQAEEDRVEPMTPWLIETFESLCSLGRTAGSTDEAGDVLIAGRIIDMAEVDDLAAPTIDQTRSEGVCACWSSFDPATGWNKTTCLKVKGGRVGYSRLRNGFPIFIPKGLFAKGHAETLRELLIWQYGRQTVPIEPAAMFDTLNVQKGD